ncbi:MAG: RNA recognition motif domain-containing protein [Planctomycetota bacterium]
MAKKRANRFLTKQLFVRGLPWALTSYELEELFRSFGEVVDAEVAYDARTRRSKGFGFVTLATSQAAARALAALDGAIVGGRAISVTEARSASDKLSDRKLSDGKPPARAGAARGRGARLR